MTPSPARARGGGRISSGRNSNTSSNNTDEVEVPHGGRRSEGARRTGAPGGRRGRHSPSAAGASAADVRPQEERSHGEEEGEQEQQDFQGDGVREQSHVQQGRQIMEGDGEDVDMNEAELDLTPAHGGVRDNATGRQGGMTAGERTNATLAVEERIIDDAAGERGLGEPDEEAEHVDEGEEDLEMSGGGELSSNSAAATAQGPHAAAAAQFVARSPISRRRRPQTVARSSGVEDVGAAGLAGAAADLQASDGGGVLGEGSQTAAASLGGGVAAPTATERGREDTSCGSEYGGTPSALRRVRYARCDLGDMGREFLLQDIDMQRLPELPREVVDSEMERKFEDFFDHFRLEDYEGLFEISEEDAVIAALGQSAFGCPDTAGGTGEASFYSLKLLQYMQQRGASLAAGIGSTFYSNTAPGIGGVGAAAGSGRGGRDGVGAGGGSCCSLSFEVSLQHLFAYDRCLYTATVNAPQDAIAAFDAILRRKYGDLREAYGCYTAASAGATAGDPEELLLQQAPRLRLFAKPAALLDNLRTLDPSVDLDRLVCLRGIVVRCSEVLPEMTLAAFRCQGHRRVGLGEKIPCMQEQYASVLNGEAIEPTLCRSCGCSQSFSLWIEQCAFASKQLVKLVEAPELLLPGEAPQAIAIYVYDELIDACRPGDRVEITGIYKAAPLRVNPRLRLQHAVFRTYINLVHVRRDDSRHSSRSFTSGSSSMLSSRLLSFPPPLAAGEDGSASGVASATDSHQRQVSQNVEGEEEEELLSGLSSDLEAKIHAISKRPDIYELLVRSFAPSLFGREEVKKGILCQLVGGSRLRATAGYSAGNGDEDDDTGAGGAATAEKGFRSGLHVLLCGDPATAKSQLLQYVHKLSPRCMYTSGRGSSAVGLTVSVSKDPETREFVLESGAVVLADGGVCCIDEFDKMEETARAVLHEVMEQQSVTVAKAGIVASLRARTAILASANPAGSSCRLTFFTPPGFKNASSAIGGHSETGAAMNAETAEKKDSSHDEEAEEDIPPEENPPLPAAFLRVYLAYCRSRCCPRLTAAAAAHLRDEYLRMRRRDASSRHPTATVRQLESLVRISEALAKLRLAPNVEASDAVEAVRLMNLATYMSLVDPLSGRIDFDQIHFGQTRQQRLLSQRVADAIKGVLAAASSASGGRATGVTREYIFTHVKERLRETGGIYEIVEPNVVFHTISRLEKEHVISRRAGGLYYLSAAPQPGEDEEKN